MRWNNTRNTTNNLLESFNPQLNSSFSATYQQPLLRNFKIDGNAPAAAGQPEEQGDHRHAAEAVDHADDAQRAQRVLRPVGAIGNLAVQRQSLQLSQQSLKDNRARVEIGTMAPLDIVQAEAEVATREEAVILAEAAIERLMDSLRALVYNPSSPDFWTARIEPTDTLTFVPTTVDAEGGDQDGADGAHRPA